MKTPIQEFRERFFNHSRISNYQCPEGRQDEVIDLETLNRLFDEVLEKEKETIKEAWKDTEGYNDEQAAEDWFVETFSVSMQTTF